jgi:gamma-glutamylcyclotransferase (GGCT)/AIG2-like uncharacterized protein YtfP
MAQSDPVRLFVYGTLLSGERDAPLLDGATLLGELRTEPLYTLVDLGVYPALIERGTVAVLGELYLVDKKRRFELDVKWQVPILFQRATIRLEQGEEAEAYVMREDQVRGKRRLAQGDWKGRFAPKARMDKAGPLVRAARARFGRGSR